MLGHRAKTFMAVQSGLLVQMMSPEQITVIVILLVALLLFISERVRPDVVALLVMFSLIVTELLSIDQAFSGFASPAVVTVWAVFIISAGLQRTGVADVLARYLLRWSGHSEVRLLLLLMLTVGGMSAFMNNIGAVAILMPVTISIGRHRAIPVSRLLMPLAFASLLGGNITLIGTPPNILASNLLYDYDIAPLGFFDFAPTGFLALTVGVLYLLLVGRHLLPGEKPAGGLSYEYAIRQYLAEMRVTHNSPLVGKPLISTAVNERYGLNVIHVRRGADGSLVSSLRTYRLEENDYLLLEGGPQALLDAQMGLKLDPTKGWTDAQWRPEHYSEEFHLAEVTLAPNSRLANLTARQIDLRRRYGLALLAVRHDGHNAGENLGDIPLRFGDSLLIQGPVTNFQKLLNDPDLLVLETPRIELRRLRKAPISVLILLGVILVAASGWLHVSAVMLAGALLIVLFGALSMEEAYRAIDWRAIFLIGGMLPLGTAMEQSGTARLLATQILLLTEEAQPVLVLGVIFVATALLTQVISNAAATVLIVPVALRVASELDVSAYPFVLATVLAASTSFLLPVGHQVNIIIFGAGGYRFSDYTRVGIWLNLLMLLVALFFVPLVWPFNP